jgi:hypothetical protein
MLACGWRIACATELLHWWAAPDPSPLLQVIVICELGYQAGVFAPGFLAGLNGKYQCGHNLLLAHGRAYRLFERKYKAKYGGEVSIALDGKWGIPYSDSPAGVCVCAPG